MWDGTRPAVDAYLPKGLAPGVRLPAILVQTHYGGWFELRRPFSWLHTPRPYDAVLFVRHGYAWVEVQVRGTGACFGRVPYPWSADGIRHGDEVVDWIARQRWSGGRVGTLGVSYDGVAAELRFDLLPIS